MLEVIAVHAWAKPLTQARTEGIWQAKRSAADAHPAGAAAGAAGASDDDMPQVGSMRERERE